MKDERYKQLMVAFGMPDSHSLLRTLQQVANEVEQDVRAKLKSQDDWIPVSEKPEKGGIAVDVWSEGDDYHEAGRYTDCLHINGNSYFEADDERQQIIPNVTHWKPITPPKEVE